MDWRMSFGMFFLMLGVAQCIPVNMASLLNHFSPFSPATFSMIENVAKMKAHWSYSKWNINQRITCESCKFGFATLQTLLKLHIPPEKIGQIIENICVDLEIQPRVVCRGILQEFRAETFYVLQNVPYSPGEICNFITGSQCAADPPGTQWSVQLPDIPKPPSQDIRPPPPDAPKLRVLHLSDLHFDMFYQEGTNAECGDPLCCRRENGPPVGKPAGRWGDSRNCDSPVRLMENMFNHISKTEQVDYILWTGDLPPHDVWNQTKQMQLIILKMTTKYLRTFFPKTPVFPALGNHESAPVDSFPPRYINDSNSIKWLYDALATTWDQWLPAESLKTVASGGFYRVDVFPGLRIISLNTNYCNNMNWWLLVNMTDPDNELQWLISELQDAENQGIKVHLIGHIPPGSDDCMRMWSRNFYKIVTRYEDTIRGQFYGHEHFDSLHLYYDPDDGHPTSVSYLGPSVTPYQGFNPGYRIYTIDGNYEESEWVPLDHETFVANLTEANESGTPPKWYREYSAKEAFGLEQLLPSDWDRLMDELETDDAKFHKFWQYYWKSEDVSVRKSCGTACRKFVLCVVKTRNQNCVKAH